MTNVVIPKELAEYRSRSKEVGRNSLVSPTECFVCNSALKATTVNGHDVLWCAKDRVVLPKPEGT
jgi:hypothetical protein